MKRILLAFALALALPLTALAQGTHDSPWIHIRVVDKSHDGANVEVNLPMSLVDVALDLAGDDLDGGDFDLDLDSDITVADLRRMWNELREAGDGDFVTVKEDDEEVRVFRRGDVVHVEVNDLRRDEEKVRLEVPVSMVDVLFDSKDEHSLNLRGALAELRNQNQGEILKVRDGDESVHIWID